MHDPCSEDTGRCLTDPHAALGQLRLLLRFSSGFHKAGSFFISCFNRNIFVIRPVIARTTCFHNFQQLRMSSIYTENLSDINKASEADYIRLFRARKLPKNRRSEQLQYEIKVFSLQKRLGMVPFRTAGARGLRLRSSIHSSKPKYAVHRSLKISCALYTGFRSFPKMNSGQNGGGSIRSVSTRTIIQRKQIKSAE